MQTFVSFYLAHPARQLLRLGVQFPDSKDINTPGAVRNSGGKIFNQMTNSSSDDLPVLEADFRARFTFGNSVFISLFF